MQPVNKRARVHSSELERRYSEARHINDAGLVVGNRDIGGYETRATSWSNGVITDLGALEGGAQASAEFSNRHGTIVGRSNFAGGGRERYLATGG